MIEPVVVRREKTVMVPIDVLWQIVEPAETIATWLPICERCERLSGTGLGRRQRMLVRWGRRVVEIDQEVVEYVPGARLAWVHVQEMVGGRPAPRLSTAVRLTIELRSAEPGTRVALTSRNDPASGWARLLLRLVGRRRIERAFDRALANLARSGDGE